VILGGAAGPRTAADIAEFCDGWMPIGARHALGDGLVEIRRACEAIGRDPSEIELGIFFAKPDQGELDRLAEAGAQRVVFGLPQGPRDEVLSALDDLMRFV
jgi:alkanesulfonate monooxygenase SsuD/methylene tetrahydromethanopterin reductase-like flavin-dependent oxidoreductase (luciferase family)